MAGQGQTTNAIAEILRQNGWTVIFKCIPNTPHVGVVPIPIQGGAAVQRYPDILSFRDTILRLSEIEIALSDEVVEKTIERFREQLKALNNPDTWLAWRARVASLTGWIIPTPSRIQCELVLCKPIKAQQVELITRLTSLCINVHTSSTYLVQP